jgi:hypothetical protein
MQSIETRIAKLEATAGGPIDLPVWCKNPATEIDRMLCDMIAGGGSIADLMKSVDGKTRGNPNNRGTAQ